MMGLLEVRSRPESGIALAKLVHQAGLGSWLISNLLMVFRKILGGAIVRCAGLQVHTTASNSCIMSAWLHDEPQGSCSHALFGAEEKFFLCLPLGRSEAVYQLTAGPLSPLSKLIFS